MKINRVDLLYMYPIGIVALLVGGIIVMQTAFSTLSQIIMWTFLLIPGVFYFYRNQGYESMEAVKISVLFGFTFFPAYFFFIMVPFGFFEILGFGNHLDLVHLAYVDWGEVLYELVKSGVITSILTIAAYLLVRYFKLK